MKILKWAALALVGWTASVSCHAQQKFPLRPGEWAMTTPGMADPMMFCFNDELWQKALLQNLPCTIQGLTVTSDGISYSIDCPGKSFQMKGTVSLTFDGQEHMTGKGSLESTLNGKTKSTPVEGDYRWKNAQCNPDNDWNMREKKQK